VETRKQRRAAQAERSATLAVDRINAKLESSDDIPLSTLVPVFGVSVDKLAILRGGDPTFTIHHQHTHSHQHELIQALNNAVQRFEKRAQSCHCRSPGAPVARPHQLAEKTRRKRQIDEYLTNRLRFHAF